jgi:hypothetical protein
MPAATNKSDLIATHTKEYEKLWETLDTITPTQADLHLPDETSTPRSTINHRTKWMKMFIGWYTDGVAGKEVSVPAKGYKWNQLVEYNATLWEKAKDTSWEDILKEFKKTYKKFIDLIESLDEEELYQVGKYEWPGKGTVGRYSESAGSSHFRSARVYIRKILNHHK